MGRHKRLTIKLIRLEMTTPVEPNMQVDAQHAPGRRASAVVCRLLFFGVWAFAGVVFGGLTGCGVHPPPAPGQSNGETGQGTSVTTPQANGRPPEPKDPSDRSPIAWPDRGKPQLIAAADLNAAIDRSGGYLIRTCGSDGRFVYQIHLNPNITLPARYNLLRHAGTMYALAEFHRRSPRSESLTTLKRSAGFLHKCLGPVDGDDKMLAVWSDQQLTGEAMARQAKLGGAGLALVALVSLEQIEPGTTPRENLARLARFICHMQKDDGSFYSKYYAGRGPDTKWVSLYYPGEAALGLVMLYELDGNVEWLQAAADAIGYLARPQPANQPPLPDHWMLLACERLLPLYDRCRPPRPRAEIEAHVRRTCRRFLNAARRQAGHALLAGCFTDDGRTTPTSTRLEGLLATLSYLPAGDVDRSTIERACDQGVHFLLRTQVVQGEHAGAIPRAIAPLPVSDPRHRALNPWVREVRVDYVQHALSALIRYEQVRLSSSPQPTKGDSP